MFVKRSHGFKGVQIFIAFMNAKQSFTILKKILEISLPEIDIYYKRFLRMHWYVLFLCNKISGFAPHLLLMQDTLISPKIVVSGDICRCNCFV